MLKNIGLSRSRSILAVMAFLFAVSALAFTPRTGHWWDPAQSGTGFNIDVQNGVIVIVVYSYKTNGDPEWYLASGNMSNGQRDFSGPLEIYRGGQCISCRYAGEPTSNSNAGTLTIHFNGALAATVNLPGGRVANIQPLNVGFGMPPEGLLGEWMFVELIGATAFVDHYDFTLVGSATADGTGLVVDPTRFAACELQISGPLAGHVLCAHWTSATLATVADLYVYQWGLDQTFDGFWISPATYVQYAMNGFAWTSRSGFPKALGAAISGQSQSDLKRQAELTGPGGASPMGVLSPERAVGVRSVIEAFQNAIGSMR